MNSHGRALNAATDENLFRRGATLAVKELHPDERVPTHPAEHWLLRYLNALARGLKGDRDRIVGRVLVRALEVVLESHPDTEPAERCCTR